MNAVMDTHCVHLLKEDVDIFIYIHHNYMTGETIVILLVVIKLKYDKSVNMDIKSQKNEWFTSLFLLSYTEGDKELKALFLGLFSL